MSMPCVITVLWWIIIINFLYSLFNWPHIFLIHRIGILLHILIIFNFKAGLNAGVSVRSANFIRTQLRSVCPSLLFVWGQNLSFKQFLPFVGCLSVLITSVDFWSLTDLFDHSDVFESLTCFQYFQLMLDHFTHFPFGRTTWCLKFFALFILLINLYVLNLQHFSIHRISHFHEIINQRLHVPVFSFQVNDPLRLKHITSRFKIFRTALTISNSFDSFLKFFQFHAIDMNFILQVENWEKC